jgi:hypothetical protein
MRVTGWTAATLRAQPARVIRAHFARIFAGLVWSPELATAVRAPAAPRGAFSDIAAYVDARKAKGAAVEALKTLERALWPEAD